MLGATPTPRKGGTGSNGIDSDRLQFKSAVPEPTSLLLLSTGLGVIGLAAWRRKK